MTNILPSDSATNFPAPREDEPASLRQDILDELADHLACASLREQHLQTDISKVPSAVLARFGNPGQIACQLWQDAMWEKIMSQRILVITNVAVSVVAILAVALIWQATRSNAEFQQTQFAAMHQLLDHVQSEQKREREASLAVLNSLQETNRKLQGTSHQADPAVFEKLFSKMQEEQQKDRQATVAAMNSLQETNLALLAKSASTSGIIEWSEVQLQLRRGSDQGPPAKGVEVRLIFQNKTALPIPDVTKVSDESGLIIFKNVHYGTYELICKESDAVGRVHVRQELLPVPVSESVHRLILCPTNAEGPFPVSFQIELPEEFREIPVNMAFGDRIFPAPLNNWVLQGFPFLKASSRTGEIVCSHDQQYSAAGINHMSERLSELDDGIQGFEILGGTLPVDQLLWPGADYFPNQILIFVTPAIPTQMANQMKSLPGQIDQIIAHKHPSWPSARDILGMTGPATKATFRQLDHSSMEPFGTYGMGMPSTGMLNRASFRKSPSGKPQIQYTMTGLRGFKIPVSPSDFKLERGEVSKLTLIPSEELQIRLRQLIEECDADLKFAQSLLK